MKETFLNKEVLLYPDGTTNQWGIVREINEAGVVVEITRVGRKGSWSNGPTYASGDVVFLAYSKKLAFRLVREGE